MMTNYRAIFVLRDSRLFWLGFTISALGDAMTRVALIWYVYDVTGSSRSVGLLMFCFTGPVLIGGLVAGSFLDRFDRRNVRMADSVVRGLAMLSVPVLAAAGQLQLWHIFLVAAFVGALMMISLAGGPAMMPDLVSPDLHPTANALEMLSFTSGSVVGPVIAGVLVTLLGAPRVVLIDAATYGTLRWRSS